MVTIRLQDNNSKATSFLFLFKVIAKLKWAQSIVKQNKDKHRTTLLITIFKINHSSEKRYYHIAGATLPKIQGKQFWEGS